MLTVKPGDGTLPEVYTMSLTVNSLLLAAEP